LPVRRRVNPSIPARERASARARESECERARAGERERARAGERERALNEQTQWTKTACLANNVDQSSIPAPCTRTPTRKHARTSAPCDTLNTLHAHNTRSVQVDARPDGLIGLVSYEDAAGACLAALSLAPPLGPSLPLPLGFSLSFARMRFRQRYRYKGACHRCRYAFQGSVSGCSPPCSPARSHVTLCAALCVAPRLCGALAR
jgi:hypothetical protein